MTFEINSSRLTGIPDSKIWTQIHEFKPSDLEKLEKRGHLFAVISLKKGESFQGEDGVVANVSLEMYPARLFPRLN